MHDDAHALRLTPPSSSSPHSAQHDWTVATPRLWSISELFRESSSVPHFFEDLAINNMPLQLSMKMKCRCRCARPLIFTVIMGLLLLLLLPQDGCAAIAATNTSASPSGVVYSEDNVVGPAIILTQDPPPPDCSSMTTNSRYKALVCWLYNLNFILPPQKFTESIFNIDIHDMICTHFHISTIQSTILPDAPPGSDAGGIVHPSIDIDLQGMSATCSGKYDLGGIWGSGDVMVSIVTSTGDAAAAAAGVTKDTPTLHLQLDITSQPLGKGVIDTTTNAAKAALPFPTSVKVTSCQPNFIVGDVKFSGSISSHLIGLFSGVISDMVSKAMNDKSCSYITEKTEVMLNSGLKRVKQYLAGLILNETTPTTTENEKMYLTDFVSAGGEELSAQVWVDENDDTDNYKQMYRFLSSTATTTTNIGSSNGLSWDKDMPFLKRILVSSNNFISQHLNEGIILKLFYKLSTWSSAMDTTDCTDCGYFFKGLNGLIKSLLTKTGDDNGSLEIVIPDKFLIFHHNHTIDIPNYGKVIVTARRLKISGLDNFTNLLLFYPLDQNTLSTSIASIDGFNISILIDLEVRPMKKGATLEGDTLNETFEVHFNTSNVNFTSLSSWELDADIFSKLSVGSFMFGSYTMTANNPNPLNCILETLKSATVNTMLAHMSLDNIQISPSTPSPFYAIRLEDDIDDLINRIIKLLLSEYSETSTEALFGIIQVPVRNHINAAIESQISTSQRMPLHCINVDIPKNPERPLRFDSNKIFTLLNEIVNTESTVGLVNEFITCVNNVVDAKKLVTGHFFNFSIGELEVVMHDLHMENVNSVNGLTLVRPEIDHYHLMNNIDYGNTNTSFVFGMNLIHSKLGNLGNINYRIYMHNVQFQGGTELRYDMNYLPFLSITDLMSHPQCLSIPIIHFDFYGFNFTVDMMEINVDVSLSGEHIEPHSYTYKTVNSTTLGLAISAVTSYGAYLFQEALKAKFLLQLSEASEVCNTPVNPYRIIDDRRSTGAAGFWTFIIILLFITFNAWLFLRQVKNADRDGMALLAELDEQQRLTEPLMMDNHDGMDDNLEIYTPSRKYPLTSSSSLMYHPTIHSALKLGVPAVLALALVLFFSSNLSIGASVDLLISQADGTHLTPIVNIYAFSLGSTISEMAKAGVWLLMLLIVFCSGIWPYAKLILMIACWITSTRRLQPVKREKILYLLDSLGKFSLIDAYVLVLMMVAFRYNLKVEGVGALDVYVTPKYGFYSFLFATIISLVGGHLVLFLHRRTMIPFIPVYSGRKESLSRHVFDDKRGRGLVRLTKRFRRSVLAAIILTFILICVGVNLPSFHFKFNGVAGTALGEDRIRRFSLVTIGEHISQSVASSSFGVYWIQTSYFFFALVMPIVCLASMVALFLVPMTLKQQTKVFLIAEVTNAWSAIEVFVIAVVASLLELSPFAESMVGEHCGLINQILSGWSGGTGEHDLHYCFDVKSSIDGSAAVLITAVILNSFLVSSLHRFAHHALWERVEREDRPDATELENKTVRECVHAHTFLSRLRKRPRIGKFMFEEVNFGPNSEYSLEFEDVVESNDEEPHTLNDFWSEWRKIVSVI